MADNEQELLMDEEIDKMVRYPIATIHQVKRLLQAQVAKLKTMGYVKWDREKVAGKLASLYGITEWGVLSLSQKSDWLIIADQLKEIKTER